jgi:RsiW-degrading membrane proteinase PrsW (M82 family)
LVPAAIWLFFFYRLDRLEPEPKQMVVGVFLLAALVTAALHDPLIDGLFTVRDWLYQTWWGHLLGGILIVGFVEQFLIYATVRYVMFNHPEFDERVDGVIYSVAAGLGLATVLNFQYVVASNGVDLDIGSIRMVVNALAYAGFAGIMGYFMGQARFEKVPVYYMPAGLTIAAVINGLFFFLLNRTFGGGLTYNPWADLVFAALVTAVALAVVFWLIERANEETLRIAHQQVRESIATPPAPVAEPPAAAPAVAPVEETTADISPDVATDVATDMGTQAATTDIAGDEPAAGDQEEKA